MLVRSSLSIVALTVACTACGGNESFTPDEVADTFAWHGVPVSEIVHEQHNSPLLSVLGPSYAPARCEDDLRINVFRGSAEVEAHLARTGFKPGESRYVTESEDGRPVVGLVHDNVLVGLTKSDCFSEARVRKPLDALGE